MIVSVGTVQNVLLCTPVASDQSSAVDQQVCPPLGNQYFRIQTQQAYVIDPASSSYIDAIAQPIDYMAAAGFWGLAFTTIITLWLVSHGAGAIVNFLRRS
ncbi:hypothetical protein [Burkholderia cepacia]|uniref:hypothetical protein n=1 Tax=Burkholderia cepacia TaxID=292 RepID=UPI001E4B5BF8|nr:hypothetical protein [Burkholderia cepacia]